jgi:uncharacterized protein (DUF362 family)
MTAKAFIAPVTPATYLESIREGFEFVDMARLLSSQSRVFLKPNLTYPTYRPGVMTSIEAVEAAIIAVKDFTPHVYIGDSDSGGYYPFSMEKVYGEIGMYDLGDRHGVEVVNLSDLPRKTVELGGGKPIPLELPGLLTEDIDVLITLPVPKIHMYTGVSLTFKNQWGCIPEPKDRLRLHPLLPRVLYEVNKAVHAKAAIVDGRWGLTRSGPMLGDPVALDWLMVTDDIGAGARLCCDLMQVPLAKIPHLRYAERRGAIPPRAGIETNRDVDEFKRDRFYLRRRVMDYPGLLAFRSRTIGHLAFFSPLATFLHKVLYLFREPFYDYDEDARMGPR